YLAAHPGLLADWADNVRAGRWHLDPKEVPITVGSPTAGMIALVCLVVFPKLALGLSGFETGVAGPPPLHTDPPPPPHAAPHRPQARIRAPRKLLLPAALLMSVFLLGSSLVVATLIDPGAFAEGARPTAKERALAYLAHGEGEHAINPLFGPVFGTIYDI